MARSPLRRSASPSGVPVTAPQTRPHDPAAWGRAFDPPVRVRVLQQDAEQPGLRHDVALGTLIDRLEVGKSFRVSTSGEALLATSSVRAIEAVGPGAVQVRTERSLYRLERLPSARGAGHTLSVEATTARLASLRMRRRRIPTRPAAQGGEGRETAFVSLQSAPGPRAGRWCAGARIRVTRLRVLGGPPQQVGELGEGVLLDDLEAGCPARFSVEEGPCLVTSPVRSLHRMGARSVQAVTGNSTYRFDLLSEESG